MREGMDVVTIYIVGGGILLIYGAWDLARSGFTGSGFTGSTAYWIGVRGLENNIEQKIPTQTGVSDTQARAMVLMGAPGR